MIPATGLPPIYLRHQRLDVLDEFHNLVRHEKKLREQPKTYERHELWEREARRRFGPDKRLWRWLCHRCKRTMSAMDYVGVGAPQSQIGFDCVTAFLADDLGCGYRGANHQPGNPITVHVAGQKARMLAFAD